MNTQELNAAAEIAKKIADNPMGYTPNSVSTARAFLALYEATRWQPITNISEMTFPCVVRDRDGWMGVSKDDNDYTETMGFFCGDIFIDATHWKPLDTPEE